MDRYVGEPIGQILSPSSSGALIPLGQCNVTGRDIGGFVNEARTGSMPPSPFRPAT